MGQSRDALRWLRDQFWMIGCDVEGAVLIQRVVVDGTAVDVDEMNRAVGHPFKGKVLAQKISGEQDARAGNEEYDRRPVPTRVHSFPARSFSRATSMQYFAQGLASRRGLPMGLPVSMQTP